MSQRLSDRIKENLARQGGRAERRSVAPPAEVEPSTGPGKRAEEVILSLSVDEVLPDRYQGRLRWPVDLAAIERLYGGAWDAQDFLDHVASLRQGDDNPALSEAWEATVELARSILAEGQVAPITVAPTRELPIGYRFVIETGEGRYWAYQMMRWLLRHAPSALPLPADEWREDPAFIRAVAIPAPSRLRQVAENEQRQSYASGVDRAIAYASMLAEAAGEAATGTPPGIRDGLLELPEAYWKAARRGLRKRKAVLQQVPASERQIQRHLQLLTNLDPQVLARAKQHGLSEAQLRPLLSKPADEQRHLVERIIQEGLSSRAIAAARELQDDEGSFWDESGGEEEDERFARAAPVKAELTLPEEVSRLLRSLNTAVSRYEALHRKAQDREIVALLEMELRSFDEAARGARRAQTPRRRLQRLLALLQTLEHD